MENNVVSVMLWGEEVGKLYWDEKKQKSRLQLSSGFHQERSGNRPTDRFCQRTGGKGYAHTRKQRKDLSRSPTVFGRFIA